MTGKSVLIAAADPNLLTALTLRLEQMGLDVRTADDCMAALTMIHTDPPSLAILDVNMPPGNGLGCVRCWCARGRRHPSSS
ncbi:MAG: response regulator [Planctomycetes bacterium]|nr:response regulator [Planctomycetota bacterium]